MSEIIIRKIEGDLMDGFREIAGHIWDIANSLRNSFKKYEYEKIILPFTVLRRFDCILEPHKDEILEAKKKKINEEIIKSQVGLSFLNTSNYNFSKLINDSNNIEENLRDYINGYSDEIKDILDKFNFFTVIEELKDKKLLYSMVKKFSEINLDINTIDNLTMGYAFEELIRRFAEASNETAGEHFTPREIIELIVDLIIGEDSKTLKSEGKVIKILDPACGTGGMLSIARNRLKSLNASLSVYLYGQEVNSSTFAISSSDMLIKGEDNSQIKYGDSFTEDKFENDKFVYMLANPPFGDDWKENKKYITDEYNKKGYDGRFGAGLPRVSDGSLLFLQHMIKKMDSNGSRIGIVFNGSPLFTGAAGSGESNIRKWIIEQDLLEGIVSLPDQLFFNTGIPTYIWILTNKKSKRRKGKIRLVNGSKYFTKLRKALNNKRNEIDEHNRDAIVKLYYSQEPHKDYKDFDNTDFCYTSVTIERPMIDENGNIVKDSKKKPKADSNLRDVENIPFKSNIDEYFKNEVLPHVPDAWLDRKKDKIGYEIPFTRHFYEFTPLRSSEDIKEEIEGLESKIIKGFKDFLEK